MDYHRCSYLIYFSREDRLVRGLPITALAFFRSLLQRTWLVSFSYALDLDSRLELLISKNFVSLTLFWSILLLESSYDGHCSTTRVDRYGIIELLGSRPIPWPSGPGSTKIYHMLQGGGMTFSVRDIDGEDSPPR